MPFRAVVFDFDGCLVDSAKAKYDAFFEVFPKGRACAEIIARVLSDNPDGSRYEVIPRIANSMRLAGLTLDDHVTDQDRVAAYGRVALEAVARCPSMPEAEELLRYTRDAGLVYISSNTPEGPLKELVERRGWLPLLDGVYGYPRRKHDTVREIVHKCDNRADRVLVVGDGVSDESAARTNGCAFVAVNKSSGLAPAFAILGRGSVRR